MQCIITDTIKVAPELTTHIQKHAEKKARIRQDRHEFHVPWTREIPQTVHQGNIHSSTVPPGGPPGGLPSLSPTTKSSWVAP